VAVPVLLLRAGHGKLDVPKECALAQARQPDVDWRLAQPLVPHPLLRAVPQERVCVTIKSTYMSEAVGSKPEGIGATSIGTSPLPGCVAGEIPPDTAILLVGRGTHGANANATFFRIGRLFAEVYECSRVEVSFVSQTTSSVSDGLWRCAALGAWRIVVVPHFLNTGVLVRWINEQVAGTLPTLPETKIQVRDHLGVHHVVPLLLLRAREAALGVYALPCLAGTSGQGSLPMSSTPLSPERAGVTGQRQVSPENHEGSSRSSAAMTTMAP